MVKTDIRAVLFDLDGVLVDAPRWHKEAFDRALEIFGAAPLSDEEHHKTYNGLSTTKKLEMLVVDGRVSPDIVKNIHDKKQELTIEIIKENCRPIDRIKESVFWLYRNGFKTGVVTNCSKHSAQLMLKLSGLIGCWHTCITNEDVDGYIKPHPWPYVLGVSETCFFVERAMVIDDSHHGVQSAKAAGIGKIWHLEKFSDLTLGNLKARLEA